MDFMAIWNEICYHMSKSKNATERDFQTTIEFLFEKLGWSQFRGEIVSKEVIPVGSAQRVMPDIVIKNKQQRLFVVELKKPTVTFSSHNADQLISYMRLLRLDFGILLGETLQVFYEIPSDNKPPVRVSNIEFIQDSDDGAEIIEILAKADFSFERFQKYCIDKIADTKKRESAESYINLLCSKKGSEIVVEILKEKLLTEFSEDMASFILKQINIVISKKCERINDSCQQPKNIVSTSKPKPPFQPTETKVNSETHITERALLIRINQTFNGSNSAQKLYDITRSAWKLGERRNSVDYVFSVYKGTVVEVYKVNYWELATAQNVPYGHWDSIKDVGRYQFVGQVDIEMSANYKGKNISHYFKPGAANPTMYLNV